MVIRASVFLMCLSWMVKRILRCNECQMESDEVMSHSEGCICIMQRWSLKGGAAEGVLQMRARVLMDEGRSREGRGMK